jgi:signal transduction histidine kinase
MLSAGTIAIVFIVIHVGIYSLIFGKRFSWIGMPGARNLISIADKLLIIILAVICVVLSRIRMPPQIARIVFSFLIISGVMASFTDDIIWETLHLSPAYILLFLLVGVGTVPFRPWQIFILGAIFTLIFNVWPRFLISMMKTKPLVPDLEASILLILVTCICMVITAIIYRSRYRLFRSRQKEAKLRESVEKYAKAEKKRLKELNRMKTDFISSVSHEIRTPMSSIQGLSEVLQSGIIKDKKKHDELLDIMTRECGRLSRFLQNIIDFGKIEQKKKSYRFEKTDICEEIKDVAGLFIPQLESSEFIYEVLLPDDPVFLNIDKDAVKQVLINLLDNAIKYSEDKKQIRIELIEMENSVEIHIKDWGIGIPLPEQKKEFKGFYRAKEAYLKAPRGVGLGLKITKHIMDVHGGKIKVESKSGHGSDFILIFPKQ